MIVFLRSLIYIMELKCLNLRFLIYLAKITYFLSIQRSQFCSYSTKQSRDFVKFLIFSNNEIQSRNPKILFMYVGGFLKKKIIRQIRAHLKQKNLRTSILWLGRESVQNVARTRKCAECGSDEEMRWLALHPSLCKPYHPPLLNPILTVNGYRFVLLMCTMYTVKRWKVIFFSYTYQILFPQFDMF